mmetsp:Transcript_6175/g.14243  ORF Transcript_6175/g.14243 Transcript_6175/m.14243 type:complete len:204 (-) Transcript_6175:192-803(-)
MVEQPAEGARDGGGAALWVEGVVREVGQLEQQRAQEVHRLDELEVDVHVVRDEPPPFEPLLLGVALGEARRGDRLREQLLQARARRRDLHERRVRLRHQLVDEGADAQAHERPVVQDLRRDVRLVHRVAEVRHEQYVARRVVLAVQREVVHVTQQRARLRAVGAVLVDACRERCHERLEHARPRHREVARRRCRLRRSRFHQT